MSRRRLPIALLVALALIGVIAPATTHAHSSLLESTPAIGATVGSSPKVVQLRFSDPITMTDGLVSVLDLSGDDHVRPGIQVDGRDVEIPIDGDREGTRVVAWSGISDHGTEVSGSFVFHVGGITDGAQAAGSVSSTGAVARELTLAARSIAGTSLVLLALGISWLVARRRARRSLRPVVIILSAIGAVIVAAAGTGLAADGSDFPRGADEPRPSMVEQQVSLGDGSTASVVLDPARAGATSLAIDVRTGDGKPDGDAREASIRYRPADKRLGYFKLALDRDGPGRFSADDVIVPFAGDWEFEVVVAADKFSSALATFTADVAPNPELEQ